MGDGWWWWCRNVLFFKLLMESLVLLLLSVFLLYVCSVCSMHFLNFSFPIYAIVSINFPLLWQNQTNRQEMITFNHTKELQREQMKQLRYKYILRKWLGRPGMTEDGREQTKDERVREKKRQPLRTMYDVEYVNSELLWIRAVKAEENCAIASVYECNASNWRK